MARRRRPQPEPSALAAPAEATPHDVIAEDRLSPLWALDSRIPEGLGWDPGHVMAWAAQHAADLLRPEDEAIRAAGRRAAMHAARNHTKNPNT
jgi:hypothetical protein